mgnify:CR=1 FL=1
MYLFTTQLQVCKTEKTVSLMGIEDNRRCQRKRKAPRTIIIDSNLFEHMHCLYAYYLWNFTRLQYTTWGCAWRRIITVQTFSREIISSDRGIGFDLQFYLYLNQTEICTFKYKKYHQTVASLVNTMKIQPLKIMVAGCWRSLTHSPTHSCQSKLMPHKSRSIYLFG